WPDLSVFAQIGQNASGEDYAFDSELQSAVGAEAGWRIGRRADIGRQLQARTEEERLRWRWHDLHQGKRQELREAMRNLEEAVARIDLAEQRLQARERLVTLYQDRYDNGEIDILELLRAQDNFESAKVTLLEARITYLELLADYRYAIGE
ncbi:MAG: TolC family protein, partial [Planctomycetota bacterium]